VQYLRAYAASLCKCLHGTAAVGLPLRVGVEHGVLIENPADAQHRHSTTAQLQLGLDVAYEARDVLAAMVGAHGFPARQRG